MRALDNLTNRVPLQDVKITTTAIMIQKESGGNLAEVLDKTAHVIRERFRLKRANHDTHGAGTADGVDFDACCRSRWALASILLIRK